MPPCAPYLSHVQMIMQFFKSHAFMLGKHLPSSAPSQHAGPPSHPHDRSPTCNVWLPPPWELLTISLQTNVPTAAAGWALPRCLSGVSCAVMGCCTAQHPACFLGCSNHSGGSFWLGSARLRCGLWFRDPFFSPFLMLLAGCQGWASCSKMLGMWQLMGVLQAALL